VILHQDYQQSLSYLFSLQKFGIKLGLANMEALMAGLGDPHLGYPSVLIGGTNGKGSTAAFLDSILRESGYRVGLYTSPHLLDFRERIRVQGRAIAERQVAEGADRMRSLIDSLMDPESPSSPRLNSHPTFFEVSTALAFQYFAQREIEMAVVEVGMGGRFDATNVLEPILSIITNVDLDHQEHLGVGLPQIAWEKAGIIREGGRLISGVTRPEAFEVIQRTAHQRGASICRLGSDVTWGIQRITWKGQQISIRGLHSDYPNTEIHLLGAHQAANAAAAVAAAEILKDQGFPIPKECIYQGLAKARWPGRMQVLSQNPLLIVDSAHNPAGTQILSQAISDLNGYRRLYLVFGVMKDKDWRSMLQMLGPLAAKVILTRPPTERAADPIHLKEEMATKFGEIEVREEVGEAISLARSLAKEEDAILIAGSIFTAAEALRVLGARVP
jgi:dihydrofolate synthase/folylpolyglutamate synthase